MVPAVVAKWAVISWNISDWFMGTDPIASRIRPRSLKSPHSAHPNIAALQPWASRKWNRVPLGAELSILGLLNLFCVACLLSRQPVCSINTVVPRLVLA